MTDDSEKRYIHDCARCGTSFRSNRKMRMCPTCRKAAHEPVGPPADSDVGDLGLHVDELDDDLGEPEDLPEPPEEELVVVPDDISWTCAKHGVTLPPNVPCPYCAEEDSP